MGHKTVLITGCNGGIGKQLVLTFAGHGYDILAHARTQREGFEEELAELAQQCNVRIKPIYFDMTDTEAMKSVVCESVIKEQIRVDVLVNCAGIAHGGLFQMTSIDEIRHVYDVNYFSVLQLTQLLLRGMVKSGDACIINVGSIAGIQLEEGNCAYGTSKAALMAFTKTLAKELAPYGVRVNAVAPGLTDTSMAQLMQKEAGEAMIADTAMKRLGTPREIAEAVLFLASDQASFITGEVLHVDGGT